MKRKARVVRCYTDQPLHADSNIELDKRASHHLSTVLRARAGMTVQLFNGDGKNYSGEVTNTGKKTNVAISQVTANTSKSSLQLTLIQAIARGDKMDGIVRQATELGVAEIQPLYTTHSVSKLDTNREERKRDHWHSIVVSACEQSGRSELPLVNPILSLNQYLNTCAETHLNTQRWILSPVAIPVSSTSGETSSGTSSSTPPSIQHTTIMIGPESGFDEDELNAAMKSGFTALQLGPRILRTETAGPAAIAVLQARFGDFV